MSLSSLIVQREVATMRQVEEALARQVVYGGDLATNLLEVAPVDETALTQLIAETMGMAPAPSGELPIADDPAQLVSPTVAEQREVIPLARDGGMLVLAVASPLPSEVIAQLESALGVGIEQRVAPAVRVRQAISRVYGLPLDRRTERLLARLSGVPLAGDSAPPPPRLDVVASVPEPPRTLISPARGPGAPAAAARLAGDATQLRDDLAFVPGSSASRPPGASVLSPTQRSASPIRRKTERSFLVPPGTITAGQTDAGASPADTAAAARPAILQRGAQAATRGARRRRGPLTFDAARREADDASDRDAVLSLFFDFARQFFEYAALFLVHGDIAEGRDAFGAGASRERVLGIGVPLDLPSLLAGARDERVAIVARAAPDALDSALLADLQRPSDCEVAAVPLAVKSRVVAILIGDCADAGIDRISLDHATAFAAVAGKALERLIVKRKLEGTATAAGHEPVAQTAPAAPPEAAPPSPRAPLPPTFPSLIAPSLMPPPPANVATVRRPSGPPIPREEPESPASLPAQGADGRALDSPAAQGGGEEDNAAIPRDLDARALFDILGWESGAETPDAAPASSAVAVPPHRPPLPRSSPALELPSVIVDLAQEMETMLDRAMTDGDESAEAELLRQGERAMHVIMSRFPGPLLVERASLASSRTPPRASDCGPLLRLVARERRVALPFVLARLSHPDPETRGWATHLIGELPYVEAIPHVLARMRDVDGATRASAVHALAALGRALPEQVRDAVQPLESSDDPIDRTTAMRALAALRQAATVPSLVSALSDVDENVAQAACEALVEVTSQNFGADAAAWRAWWEENASRHRIEWLIDGLSHDTAEIRRASSEELRTTTREYFGYAEDLPPRDRDRAQQRYRDWWTTEGRVRFRRR